MCLSVHRALVDLIFSGLRPMPPTRTQVASCRLRGWRLQGCKVAGVRLARLRRAGLQAAGCKAAGCKAASCEAAGCKVAGCKHLQPATCCLPVCTSPARPRGSDHSKNQQSDSLRPFSYCLPVCTPPCLAQGVAGCKAAGDRLRTARLQAPALESERAILLRVYMQKRLHLSRASPCNEQHLRYFRFYNPKNETNCCK